MLLKAKTDQDLPCMVYDVICKSKLLRSNCGNECIIFDKLLKTVSFSAS